MSLTDFVTYELKTGTPATFGSTTLTPQSKVLTVRWPGGGWVWNRPVAVLVDKPGEQSRLPIIDITRMAQIGFFVFLFAFGIVTLLMRFARWISR